MPKLTSEEIAALKKQYGQIMEFEVLDEDGTNPKYCYLKQPDRQLVGYCSTIAKNPIKSNEAMLKGCWVAGDMEIQDNDVYFLNVQGYLGQLVELKIVTIKKL